MPTLDIGTAVRRKTHFLIICPDKADTVCAIMTAAAAVG
jgi:hypothetical protein